VSRAGGRGARKHESDQRDVCSSSRGFSRHGRAGLNARTVAYDCFQERGDVAKDGSASEMLKPERRPSRPQPSVDQDIKTVRLGPVLHHDLAWLETPHHDPGSTLVCWTSLQLCRRQAASKVKMRKGNDYAKGSKGDNNAARFGGRKSLMVSMRVRFPGGTVSDAPLRPGQVSLQ